MFKKWFKKFIEEKGMPFVVFVIKHQGQTHVIDTDMVSNLILTTIKAEQKIIKETLVELDIQNTGLIPYFEHLAELYVKAKFSGEGVIPHG